MSGGSGTDTCKKLKQKLSLLGYKCFEFNNQLLSEKIIGNEVYHTLYICEDTYCISEYLLYRLTGNVTITGKGRLSRLDFSEDSKETFNARICITDLTIDIELNTNDSYLSFKGMDSLQSLRFKRINTGHLESMQEMFRGCTQLKELDLSLFDTHNVKSMNGMFYDCNSLTKLNISGFDTSKLESMAQMFYHCSTLTELDIRNFKTPRLVNIEAAFFGCKCLKKLYIDNLDTSKVRKFTMLFSFCEELEELDISSFRSDNVQTFLNMFSYCYKLKRLDLSKLKMNKPKLVQEMFRACSSLKEIIFGNEVDLEGTESASLMFAGCKSIERLDLSSFNTSTLLYIQEMFNGCISLRYLNIENIKFEKVIYAKDWLNGLQLDTLVINRQSNNGILWCSMQYKIKEIEYKE